MASSYKPGFEPHRARLNGFNAWCALVNDQNQFLEIDFGKYAVQLDVLIRVLNERGYYSHFLAQILTESYCPSVQIL